MNPSSARRPAESDEYIAPLQEHEAAREDAPPLPVVSEPTPAPTAAAAAATTGSQKENRTARRQRRLSVEQVRPTQEDEASHAPEVNETVPVADPHEPAPVTAPARRGRGATLEPVAVAVERMSSERGLSRSSPREEHALETPDAYQQAEMLTQKRPVSSAARMVMVLPLAALLGCFVGWLAFLQVPPPIIPLTIKARGENVVVTWPSEQTRNAIYAAVRVDDSAPVPLTPEEKSTGRVEVQARPDMKVELIARNWIRDSRGIVHYVKPVANTAP